MSRNDFDTREELADDLSAFLSLPLIEVCDRLSQRNWRRVAQIYARLLDLMEEGATYFARARRIRQNPEWAPGRPIRAELKLARINAKVDQVERQLLDALNIDLGEDKKGSIDVSVGHVRR